MGLILNLNTSFNHEHELEQKPVAVLLCAETKTSLRLKREMHPSLTREGLRDLELPLNRAHTSEGFVP